MAEPLDPDLIKRPDETLEQYVARIKPPDKPPDLQPVFDEDLIPDVLSDTRFQKEREEIDTVLARMNILDAYRKYCGKMEPNVGSKRESILVSCPFPGHADKHPSAWLNLDKGDGGVGVCATCGGFDKYDMAAWSFGMDVPGYKTGAGFPDLRREMAKGLGYTVMVSGKAEWLEKNSPPAATPTLIFDKNPPIAAAVATSQFEEQPVAPSTLHRVEPDTRDAFSTPEEDDNKAGFDYTQLPIFEAESRTFLQAWMDQMSKTTQPNEFYFFTGLMALGLTCGNKVILKDETPVRGNMMICLVGGTGSGKSRCFGWLHDLLKNEFPYNPETAHGVQVIQGIGSGEILVDQMSCWETDPLTKVRTYHSVRAVYIESELEGFMARVNRANSVLRSLLMDLNDSPRDVVINSRSSGKTIARDHFLSALTSTQPPRMSSLLSSSDAASGFTNRWFFVHGTEKFRPTLFEAEIDLTEPGQLLRNIRAWMSNGIEVRLNVDPLGLKLWDKIVQNQIRPLEATDNLLIARIELLCKKLLLLLAINDHSTFVTEIHVRTLEMLFPYLERCYGIVEKNVGLTQQEECIQAMRKYFASHPNDDITMTMLSKQSGARKFDTIMRNKAIEELLKANDIVEAPHASKTRATRWRYNPDNPTPLAQVIPIR